MEPPARWQRVLFRVGAAPVVALTGFRIGRLERALGFSELVANLRSRSAQPLPRWLARPELLAETVESLLRLSPPRKYGVCLRRALILLELWSRCGLEPTLHLGFRPQAGTTDGHAWLTATRLDGSPLAVSGPLDSTVVFEL